MNINQAIFQANIEKRAITLFTSGEYSYTQHDETCFTVQKSDGTVYAVDIFPFLKDGELGCTCPCFAEHKTCKHYRAVQMKAEEIEQMNKLYDEMAEEEEEYRLYASGEFKLYF